MATNNAVNTSLSGQTGTGAFAGSTSPTITTPKIAQINDTNSNAILGLAPSGSAVNYCNISNAATSGSVQYGADGSDTNIPVLLKAKGTGQVIIGTANTSTGVLFRTGTGLQHYTNLSFTDNSNNRTITVPDASGTMTLLGNSSTGSGNVVLQTSPSLTTPTLGVASATSINFGGSALANYNEYQTFTPTFTFATPGDQSISYSVQTGYYTRIGNMVYITYTIRFTPTYTTASGAANFTGLPFTANASGNFRLACSISETCTWPASTSMIYAGISTSSTIITLTGIGNGVAPGTLGVATFPTATQRTVVVSGFYAI